MTTHSIVHVGAGSAAFSRGLLADLISADDLGAWRIKLIGVERAATPRRSQ